MGEKDSWDGRTKGVTLTCGSRELRWKMELEALSNQEDLIKKPLGMTDSNGTSSGS